MFSLEFFPPICEIRKGTKLGTLTIMGQLWPCCRHVSEVGEDRRTVQYTGRIRYLKSKGKYYSKSNYKIKYIAPELRGDGNYGGQKVTGWKTIIRRVRKCIKRTHLEGSSSDPEEGEADGDAGATERLGWEVSWNDPWGSKGSRVKEANTGAGKMAWKAELGLTVRGSPE